MKNLKLLAIILLIIFVGCTFYWYELRPVQIKKSCFKIADIAKQQALNFDNNWVMRGQNLTKRAPYEEIFNGEYEKCLMKSGIK